MRKFIVVLAAFTLSVVVSAADNPRYRQGARIHSSQPHYNVGGNEVVFGYYFSGCDVATLKTMASYFKHFQKSDRWDDLWYAIEVPAGKCLVFGYYDKTTQKVGWAAVQNQPNGWKARSERNSWGNLGNGNQAKYGFDINSQRVELDVFNPHNSVYLNGNYILISFGY